MVTDSNWSYCSDNSTMYKAIKSLCYTRETNITLHVNYNSIRNMAQ